MEQKKIKKLVLNQETISILNDNRMNKEKGGTPGLSPDMLSAVGITSCKEDDLLHCKFSDFCPISHYASDCGTCQGEGSYFAGCCNYTEGYEGEDDTWWQITKTFDPIWSCQC